jgi:nitroimidazol reductase NimA-like FMN-containing flavoprotein (pyridoxamine 5'-phosphate oxidase superfamily)
MPQSFKNKEKAFLRSNELCRLATASLAGVPQVTPVMYAVDGDNLIIATDYGTKKFKNLKSNPRVSLVVDKFHPNKGVIVWGECVIIEEGKEYNRLLKILFARFETYRRNPWKEGEAPILKVIPTRVLSWGLG